MSPKHASRAADLAGEIARIIDGRSVRPIEEGLLAVTGVSGDKITGEIRHTHDDTVIAKFTIDVNVP